MDRGLKTSQRPKANNQWLWGATNYPLLTTNQRNYGLNAIA